MKNKNGFAFHWGAVFLAVYLGSYLCFRLNAFHFSLAPSGSPEQNLVIFSFNTDIHCLARGFYYPLVKLLPLHSYCPDRETHRLLMNLEILADGNQQG